MQLLFKGKEFGKAVKQKRVIEEDTDLRTLSKKLKISPATLSRCENGRVPDLMTFAALVVWVNGDMNSFFEKKSKTKKQQP